MQEIRLALDTNILAYAEGVNGLSAKKLTVPIIETLPRSTTFLPVQSLGELFHVLVRKARYSPERARGAILSWQDAFPQIETSRAVLNAAVDLSAQHGLTIWDAIILACSAQAGCRLLLSEDFQDGFTWNGVTVANPLASKKHELLDALLRRSI
jgi:predicted nucleic acid-binding protein